MDREAKADDDRKTLGIALSANLAMFVIGIVGWIVAHSTGLLADAFDMLADASGYLLAFIAVTRSKVFQENVARWNGGMLVLLGLSVVAEVIHHLIRGSEPRGVYIMGFALLSLAVNGAVLGMLSKYRSAQEAHLRATWVDTRADVWVNAGVLLSGAAIALTGYRYIDLIAGFVISVYVIHEGVELWRDADGPAGRTGAGH